MTPDEVRRQTIIAIFSDDYFLERLVLKGGNAIHLAHRLALRSSLDLDFSMEGDFEDVEEARRRMFGALERHFDRFDIVVFDQRLSPKPKLRGPDERPWWGGYEVRFKLTTRAKFQQWRTKPEKMRMDAFPIGPRQERSFSVDVSKHEHTRGWRPVPMEEYSIPVYTLEMIAFEKLRAICQQMTEYEISGQRTPRARDFYDIHLIVAEAGIGLAGAANAELVKMIFAAKHVPLALLHHLERYREFHRADWAAVLDSTGGAIRDFDFYFDFVLELVGRLQAFGIVDAPP